MRTAVDVAQRYPCTVFWSDEDEGFIALAPDLPGCSAFGESQLGAVRELDHAIEAWIEAAKAAGNSVPEPTRLRADHLWPPVDAGAGRQRA